VEDKTSAYSVVEARSFGHPLRDYQYFTKCHSEGAWHPKNLAFLIRDASLRSAWQPFRDLL